MLEIQQRVVEEGGLEEAVELNLTELQIRHIPKEVRQFLEGAHNVEIALLSDNLLEGVEELPKWELTCLDLANNKQPPSYPGSQTQDSPPSACSLSWRS